MDDTSLAADKPRWTLADFLSSRPYWALFFASLLMTLGGRGLAGLLPMIADAAGGGYQVADLGYLVVSVCWVFTVCVVFVVAARRPRSALVWPLAACVATALLFLSVPTLMTSGLPLLFELSYGTAYAVFPLGLAILLSGGRARRTDFGCALVLLAATTLPGYLGQVGASWLFAYVGAAAVIVAFLVLTFAAMMLLLLGGDLGFDGVPAQRHDPISPRQRSPFVVGVVLASPLILLFLISVGIYLANPGMFSVPEVPAEVYPLSFLLLIVALGACIYLAYWLYRIHGELAGEAPSQRLLTPRVAAPIGILVPLACRCWS
ncbi:hypothetical protein SAMN03159496_01375 [Rhizobium sp. NFR07]|uniref:hypothetical protein n=1 Tax=Rhizobium sp. NFR07 TaxID=1566262 RepID=UPI0008EE5A99|nr:hypothetical protein [Rhizobium sp. NFR07]SFB02759.1 hypothetical protein SAMN03159496_01375 [Rhizobium sp. NFR07]